jgi:hypothetical protein
MKLLAKWEVPHQGAVRRIELYWGDLSWIPPEQAVDILVVSAFPNDYLPTPSSLIGALARNGVSVAHIALDKQLDMREDFSCWLSKPLSHVSRYRRILCIESGWRGTPPEIADDLFRAIALSSLADVPHASLAMPLIGAGDQDYPPDQIMRAILLAAVSWFRRGLDVRVVKIVAYSDRSASLAQTAFLEAMRLDSAPPQPDDRTARDLEAALPTGHCDLFVSYAHEDADTAKIICKSIKKVAPRAQVFFDRITLEPGASWLLRIAESLDEAKYVVPLYTPRYWASSYCKDEFAAAYVRQNDTKRQILFPVYYQTSQIPYLLKTVQFEDCRESDSAKLIAACNSVCALFDPRSRRSS